MARTPPAGAPSLEATLRELVSAQGSDLHLTVGAPPLMRAHGVLAPLDGVAHLASEDTERLLGEMLHDPVKQATFAEEHEVDFSYALDGVGRFRVNAFRQRGSVALVCRRIPEAIPSIEELGLPPAVRDLAHGDRGLVLVVGATGCGKSTTLAAMIDEINCSMARHIVTVEDPIEFLHRNQRSVVNQREVGADTASFKRALRRVLRQDPDVILIGEMRDEETVEAALYAAVTGHLVLSSLHASDAPEAIDRVTDLFPANHAHQARAMLASALNGVVAQRLVPHRSGQGRVAASEVLISTPRVQDMIADPHRIGQLHAAIAEGEYYGMQTFDQSLLRLHGAGEVSVEHALRASSNPHDFKLLITGRGHAAPKRREEKPAKGDTAAARLIDAGRKDPFALVDSLIDRGFSTEELVHLVIEAHSLPELEARALVAEARDRRDDGLAA
jgi:twitching motility protein PilT